MVAHNPEEILAVVDKDDKMIGKVLRKDVHNGTLHRETVVVIVNDKKEVLVQERGDNGKLGFSVGGHFAFDEDYLTAAVRETKEEVGLEIPEDKFTLIIKRRLISDNGKNDRFLTLWEVRGNYSDKDVKIDPDELKSAKFMHYSILLELIRHKPFEFTNSFVAFFPMYAEKSLK